jgi:hypothetical protein
VSSQANRVADEGGCIEVGVLLPSVLPSIHFGFSNFYILTFCMAKTLGQRESDQANRESSQANRVSSQANRVADEGGCIEVGVLLPSVLPSIHFGFSNFYIPYVLYGQNTRSAREFLSQPRKFPSQPSMFPSQPSGFVQRSEAKLYRGGLLGWIVSRWATCCPRYTLHFVPGTRSAGEGPSIYVELHRKQNLTCLEISNDVNLHFW